MLFSYANDHPLTVATRPFSEETQAWVDRRFPEIHELAAIDLETGKEWPGIPDSELNICSGFSNGGSLLITPSEKGWHEWDLPPKWQYFTLWAWPALGAWLSLTVVWWRLRKPRGGVAAIA